MIREALAGAISSALNAAGDSGPIRQIVTLSGGDINQAARIDTPQARYFVKWHAAPPPEFFESEARGLRLLGAAGHVRVPAVIGWGQVPGGKGAFLILEFIEPGSRTGKAAECLGRQLAWQHLARQPQYGLDHDNYIGRLSQPNRPAHSWVDFYASQRLAPQRDLAARLGHLPARRAAMLDQLIERLGKWIDESHCQPSLLHGDLWGGNWMADGSGSPVLIDPAVAHGDRELDLAMTALFGGFPAAFYDAYREAFPLAAGYEDRQLLYQLYYLLAHLNLFGEGYGGGVDAVLQHYTGSR